MLRASLSDAGHVQNDRHGLSAPKQAAQHARPIISMAVVAFVARIVVGAVRLRRALVLLVLSLAPHMVASSLKHAMEHVEGYTVSCWEIGPLTK